MPRSRAAPAPASRAAPRPRPASSSTQQQQQHGASASSGGGGWFGRQAPPPAPFAGGAPPPATYSAPGGGMMSGLAGAVMQGAALGTGSAFAHRAVDSMMGPREGRVVHEGVAPTQQQAEGQCGASIKQFAECMSYYNGDMGACQPYFDAMQQCKRQFTA